MLTRYPIGLGGHGGRAGDRGLRASPPVPLLVSSGKPAPGTHGSGTGVSGAEDRGRRRSSASAACSSGPCPAWRTPSPSGASRSSSSRSSRPTETCSRRTSPSPASATWPSSASSRTSSPAPCSSRSASSASSASVRHPSAGTAPRAFTARTRRRRGSPSAMIALVIITLLVYRAAQTNTGDFPYGWWAFASHGIGRALRALGVVGQPDDRDGLRRPEHRS